MGFITNSNSNISSNSTSADSDENSVDSARADIGKTRVKKLSKKILKVYY